MKQLVETTRIGAGPVLFSWLHVWPAIYTCRIHSDRTHILLQFPSHPLVSHQPSRPGWPGVHDLSRCNGVSRSNLRAADGTGPVSSAGTCPVVLVGSPHRGTGSQSCPIHDASVKSTTGQGLAEGEHLQLAHRSAGAGPFGSSVTLLSRFRSSRSVCGLNTASKGVLEGTIQSRWHQPANAAGGTPDTGRLRQEEPLLPAFHVKPSTGLRVVKESCAGLLADSGVGLLPEVP